MPIKYPKIPTPLAEAIKSDRLIDAAITAAVDAPPTHALLETIANKISVWVKVVV